MLNPEDKKLYAVYYRKLTLRELLNRRESLVKELTYLNDYIKTNYVAASVPELLNQEVTEK